MFSCFFSKEKKSGTKKSKALNVTPVSLFKIEDNEIRQGKQLGDGSSGVVFQGEWNKKSVAIKYFRVVLPDDSDSEVDSDVYREANKCAYEYEKGMAITLSKHKDLNDYVIQYYGCIESGDNLSLVMEFMPKGDLADYVLGDYPPDLMRTMYLACDILGGLKLLHKYQIIHCDIKLENILLSDSLTAKIADFGSSILIDKPEAIYQLKGTCGYQAPELLRASASRLQIPYSGKSDIYAFGIMLAEMINSTSAYDGVDVGMIRLLTLTNDRPDIQDQCPQKIKTIIQSLWLDNPANRPKVETVLGELEAIRNKMRN